MTTTTQPTGAAFSRKRMTRVAAGIASAGVMAGLSLVAAAPASAATDADCLPANTVDATTGGTLADVQVLLDDAGVPVVCLGGTFLFAANSPLTYERTLVVHGLPGAVLDGGAVSSILRDVSAGGDTDLTVENLRFTRGNGGDADGGAIYAAALTVINSQFDNNTSAYGGAIRAGLDSEVKYSTFTDNSAAQYGGAIYADEDFEVSFSTFTGNEASSGGAIYADEEISVDSSTFASNTADGDGGAIYGYSNTEVVNSTFVGNSAIEGGAIAGYAGGQVDQSTFLDNTAKYGQSIYKEFFDFYLLANIFAGAGTSSELYTAEEDQPFIDDGANIFSTTALLEVIELPAPASTTAFEVSKALLFNGNVLASNGGYAQTVALYAGSPAVNFVPTVLKSVTVDERGVARDNFPDAGAYEFEAPVPVIAATGSEPAWWVGIAGAVLVALGGAAFFVSRRVKRSH